MGPAGRIEALQWLGVMLGVEVVRWRLTTVSQNVGENIMKLWVGKITGENDRREGKM